MWERELLNEVRGIVHIADEVDVTDWQRGYRALATNVAAWIDRRLATPLPVQRLMVLGEPASVIDYRALLIKYIDHVSREEGSTFLVEWKRPEGRFTDAEWAELKAAEAAPSALAGSGDQGDRYCARQIADALGEWDERNQS